MDLERYLTNCFIFKGRFINEIFIMSSRVLNFFKKENQNMRFYDFYIKLILFLLKNMILNQEEFFVKNLILNIII